MAYPNAMKLDALEYYAEGKKTEEIGALLAGDGWADIPSDQCLRQWRRRSDLEKAVHGPQVGATWEHYSSRMVDRAVELYASGLQCSEVVVRIHSEATAERVAKMCAEGTPYAAAVAAVGDRALSCPTQSTIRRWAKQRGVSRRKGRPAHPRIKDGKRMISAGFTTAAIARTLGATKYAVKRWRQNMNREVQHG